MAINSIISTKPRSFREQGPFDLTQLDHDFDMYEDDFAMSDAVEGELRTISLDVDEDQLYVFLAVTSHFHVPVLSLWVI